MEINNVNYSTTNSSGISASAAATLTGGSSTKSNLNTLDLISGKTSDVTKAVLSGSAQNNSYKLNQNQKSSLTDLINYVFDNVEQGSAQDEILNQINALQGLIESGNANSSAGLDPVFSLLSENLDLGIKLGTDFKLDLPAGSYLDQVA